MHRASSVRYTYADLLTMPESHKRTEIIDGELFVTPTPRVNHQRVAFQVMAILDRLVREHDLGLVVGPMTVHFREELVLEPDLVFVHKDHMDIVDREGHIHGPPDLVVEVLSPSNKDYDRNLKRKHYLEAGVGEVWIVDVDERHVEVWRPRSAIPERAGDVVRWPVSGLELEISLEEVFRGV